MDSIAEALGGILGNEVTKLVLSKPRSKEVKYKKAVITQGAKGFMVEQFTEKQAFHRTITAAELLSHAFSCI